MKEYNYLFERASKINNGVFVDLGVLVGDSSEIMLFNADIRNNKVFGVDVNFGALREQIRLNKNYSMIKGDSVITGKQWERGNIDGLFVDTMHTKEQVMCELYYWYDHIKPGGFIAFHDTNWPDDKYDGYGGMTWPRVEEGIKAFFGITSLDYEDNFIKSINYPEGWGMTIIDIKEKKDYKSLYTNWGEIFIRREQLINSSPFKQ